MYTYFSTPLPALVVCQMLPCMLLLLPAMAFLFGIATWVPYVCNSLAWLYVLPLLVRLCVDCRPSCSEVCRPFTGCISIRCCWALVLADTWHAMSCICAWQAASSRSIQHTGNGMLDCTTVESSQFVVLSLILLACMCVQQSLVSKMFEVWRAAMC